MPLTNKNMTRSEIVVATCAAAVVVFCLAFFVIAYTPLRNFIPGYPTQEVRTKQIQTAMRLDSLERSVRLWEFYSENLRKVISGEKPVRIDSLVKAFNREEEQLARTGLEEGTAHSDSLLRALVMEKERFSISRTDKSASLPIEGRLMFKPVSGTVSEGFEAALHPFVEISARGGSTVKSILKGTVVYAEWTQEHLWTIIIQHDADILSVYRNNQKLLRETGEKVEAGSAIAILDKGADGAARMELQIWNAGKVEDPERYINF